MSRQINALDKSISQSKIVFLLAWPAIVEQLLQTCVSYVDAMMVGSVGVDATAAVAVSTSYVWLFIGIVNGLGVGYSVMVAKAIGENNLDRGREIIRQSIMIMFAAGIVTTVVTQIIIAPNLAIWMGAEESIHQSVENYIRIIGAAMLFEVFIIVCGAIIRGSGDTKTPMLYNFLNNVTNIILNFLFIYPSRKIVVLGFEFNVFGFDMGVEGAALGTALAALISGLLMLMTLFKGNSNVKIAIKDKYKFDSEINREMFILAIPVAFERMIHSVGQMVVTSFASGLGNIALAAHQLANTAESICFMPTFGFSVASTTMIAQSIGGKDNDLAKTYAKLCLKYGVIIMAFSAVIMFIFAPQLMSIFIKDSAVIALGALVLRIQAFGEIGLAIANISSGIFKGTGDTKWPFYISVTGMWGVRIIPAFILINVFDMGLTAIWIPMAIDWTVRAAICLYRFKGDKWLSNK